VTEVTAQRAEVARSEVGQPDLSGMVRLQIRAVPARQRISWVAVAVAWFLLFLGSGAIVAWRVGQRPSDEVLVRFQVSLPGARSVSLVGSFTSWDITRLPMTDPAGDGAWQVSVRLKKGSIYTYNFVVDGRRWIVDPGASAQVDDGFGGHSSVIRL
jgi:hypothetical protein